MVGIFFAFLLVVTIDLASHPQLAYGSTEVKLAATSNQQHLGCVLVSGSGQQVTVNDSDSAIKYSGPWGPKTDHDYDYHYAPYPLNGVTIRQNLGAKATLTFHGNSISIGSIAFFNRGFMDIFIDGSKVDSFSMYAPFGLISWGSQPLSCAEHTLEIAQADKAGGNGGRGIVLDYFQYQQCNGGGSSYKCDYLAGAGENADGCTTKGQSCVPGSSNTHPTVTSIAMATVTPRSPSQVPDSATPTEKQVITLVSLTPGLPRTESGNGNIDDTIHVSATPTQETPISFGPNIVAIAVSRIQDLFKAIQVFFTTTLP